MPTFVQVAQHPTQWVEALRSMLKDTDDNSISGSLKNAEKAAVILGAAAQQHPQFAEIYAAAQSLAQECGAKFGILPQAANSVAADMLEIRPTKGGNSLQEMLATPKKAVILVNVEPLADTVNGNAAMTALQSAETVIALTAYQTPSLLEAADVLLPITPFTETSGSFINMEGRLQSFYGVVQPLGEARPMWKVLRVLGNRLHLAGFDYNSSPEVLKAATPASGFERHLDNLVSFNADNVSGSLKDANINNLWRVGGVGLYDTDNIVRHAKSLQHTVWAAEPKAVINSRTAERLGLGVGNTVAASQANGGDAVVVTIDIDDNMADGVVYLPTHALNYRLGAMMNTIELKWGE